MKIAVLLCVPNESPIFHRDSSVPAGQTIQRIQAFNLCPRRVFPLFLRETLRFAQDRQHIFTLNCAQINTYL